MEANSIKTVIGQETIAQVPVRVAAEIGRVSRTLNEALGMKPGEVVDLAQAPNDPVCIYIDGVKYASGQLTVVDGQWAVKLEKIFSSPVDRP